MFETLIVRPIFNLLTLILAALPGHNLGLAIIVFTIVVRFLLWPLLKKQIHHQRAMRELQPELKRIKAEAAGDRQKESALTMELYRERELNPFSSIGIILLQLPILIGLYIGLRRVIDDPHNLIKLAYEPVRNLDYIQGLKNNINNFDATLFGWVDLKRAASSNGVYYLPALLIAAASAAIQYFQSKQLMPNQEKARTIRQILKDSGAGKQADPTEMSAAVSNMTLIMIPALILLIALGLPSALPLYWLTSGIVAYWQQGRILAQDTNELMTIADKAPTSAKVVSSTSQPSKTKPKAKPKTKKKKGKK